MRRALFDVGLSASSGLRRRTASHTASSCSMCPRYSSDIPRKRDAIPCICGPNSMSARTRVPLTTRRGVRRSSSTWAVSARPRSVRSSASITRGGAGKGGSSASARSTSRSLNRSLAMARRIRRKKSALRKAYVASIAGGSGTVTVTATSAAAKRSSVPGEVPAPRFTTTKSASTCFSIDAQRERRPGRIQALEVGSTLAPTSDSPGTMVGTVRAIPRSHSSGEGTGGAASPRPVCRFAPPRSASMMATDRPSCAK